jgi:hypothetical protein
MESLADVFFPRTSLVKIGWTGPRGGSTGVRVTWPVWPPDWQTDCQSDPQFNRCQDLFLQSNLQSASLADWLSACPRRLNRSYGRFNRSSTAKSAQRLVLKPHLYILTPTSLPTQELDPNSISNLKNTSHSLSHISCLSHFKSLERNLWVSLRAAVFVLHLQISLALLHSSFGTTSSSLWIHYSWSF